MEIIMTQSFYMGGNEFWYKGYKGETFFVREQGEVYILELNDENRAKLEEKDLETFEKNVLVIQKEHAESIENMPYIPFKVTFNDGGWRSGGLPSYNIVARRKEEACRLAVKQYPSYKTWESWATPIEFEGYDIVLIQKTDA